MTLKRALETLPHDRATDAALRDVLRMFKGHAGEWMESTRACRIIEEHHCICRSILDALVGAFVLDFDGDTGRYRMPTDRFLFLEIDGFLRVAGAQNENLQANVARFRHMYGAR